VHPIKCIPSITFNLFLQFYTSGCMPVQVCTAPLEQTQRLTAYRRLSIQEIHGV